MKPIRFGRRPLVCSMFAVLLWPLAILATGFDDFNDNFKDPAKWGADTTSGHGLLTETNQRLEFTCSSPTLDDTALRPWVLTQFPYNADWEMQMDTSNTTSPSSAVQVNSNGIQIFSPNGVNALFVELYASAFTGPPARNGFFSSLDNNGVRVGAADTGALPVVNGAVRMAFNSATKVITVFYDLDVSDGYQWVQYGSFGTAGVGGANGNFDWGLASSDQISAFVFGFSQGMTVTSGQIFGDNFMETGGVAPIGPPPSPFPTGIFNFAFPTGNPALTAIVSIAGNYHGVVVSNVNRNYNIDVAEDESGKLSVMGTMDGVLDNHGSPQVSANVGTVKTMNGQPTAQLNGNFNGSRDGMSVNASGNATGVVKLVDIGGGQMGATGTGGYSSNIGGMHFGGNNLPLMVTAPPGAAGNLKKDWSLHLDIHERPRHDGHVDTFASGQLLLPTGDTISFAEKKINYKADRGFYEEINFDKATNISVNPPKKTDKVSIKIKRISFVQQGASWRPTGGTIEYNFLGQKGTANLLDFIGP